MVTRERIVVRRVLNLPTSPNRISGIYVHGKLPTDNILPTNLDGVFEVLNLYLQPLTYLLRWEEKPLW